MVVIISTCLIFIFAVVVVIAIVKYRNKQKEFLEREHTIKNELLTAILEAKEQTLKELAERIHGDIQQTLSIAKLNLNKVLAHPEAIDTNKIKKTKELIADTIKEVKALSKDLDPKYITGHTLEENIEQQLGRVEKNTDLKTVFKTSKEEIQVAKEIQIFIYRIIQEAINNILAHSGATLIQIDLKNNKNSFDLIIQDNGNGFDLKLLKNREDHKKLGIGLMSMRNRTKLINGTFDIISKPNNGSKIILKIPNNV